MPTRSTRPAECTIERIPADDTGLDFYLREYKPFRLTALQQDPHAFGSTYGREKTYADERWRARLFNPLATTYVAVRASDRRMLSSTTLWRHAEPPPSVSLQLQDPGREGAAPQPARSISHADAEDGQELQRPPQRLLHFHLTGVYTLTEARGQGLGQAVMRAAIEGAQQQQQQHNRVMGGGFSVGPIVDVDVYEANTAAVAFYKKCGFEIVGLRPADEDTESLRPEVMMRYRIMP